MLTYIIWCLCLSVVGAAFILRNLGWESFSFLFWTVEDLAYRELLYASNLLGFCVIAGAFSGAYWGAKAMPEFFVHAAGMIAIWALIVFLIIFACCEIDDLLDWLTKKECR